jgi:hypothetical protein
VGTVFPDAKMKGPSGVTRVLSTVDGDGGVSEGSTGFGDMVGAGVCSLWILTLGTAGVRNDDTSASNLTDFRSGAGVDVVVVVS